MCYVKCSTDIGQAGLQSRGSSHPEPWAQTQMVGPEKFKQSIKKANNPSSEPDSTVGPEESA